MDKKIRDKYCKGEHTTMKCSRLKRWMSCLLSVLMIFTMLPSGVIAFAEGETNILSFEETNPVASVSYKTDDIVSASDFPSELTAVIACTPTAFEQVRPDSTGSYTAPDNADSLYDEGQTVIYSFVKSEENTEYRVYGTVDGVTGWFACNADGTITGKIQTVSITWDTTSIDTSTAGDYTANGSVEGYTLSCDAPQASVKVTAKSGDETIDTYSIAWISGSPEGTSLTLKPDRNQSTRAAYQIEFSKGGDEDIPAGNIEIRVPAHIFYGRDGKAIDTITVPLAKAPEESGDTGFNYTIDEEKNEVVITNYRTIDASYHFKCQIGYDFMPFKVANGYTNTNIQADFKVKNSSGELNAKSDVLSVEVQTYFNSPTVLKSFNNKYEYWQESSWGEKPDDAEDYFYVEWQVRTDNYWFASQPFKLKYEENTGDGILVAWKSQNYFGKYTRGTKEEFENTVFYDSGENATYVTTSVVNYIIVKYPRTLIGENDTVVSNNITVKIEGYDGEIKTASNTASYTYVAPDLSYKGDNQSVTKNITTTSLEGGINVLESGQNIESFDFGIYINSRGFEASEEGTKPYTTVLEDGFLTIDQKSKLNPEDYSFKSFYVNQFNENGYRIDPEKGYVDVLNEDYSSYQPVKVQVKTTDNLDSWIDVGEIIRQSKSSFYWKGKDGSEQIVNSVNRVNLPSNVYDIRFVHTGTSYSFNFRAYLNVELHPTENILEQVKDRYYIDLYNVDSGYAMNEAGEIFGDHTNYLSNNLKTIIANNDNEIYGQEVSHSYAKERYYRLTPKSYCEKSASTPESEVTNSREKVHYQLKYYEYVGSNVLSIQELIDTNAITEQREGIFYELLPIGMEIDLDSIVVKTYSIYEQKQKECDYTIEMIENWRESGRTMLKIHVTVPDDVTNYDNDIYTTSKTAKSGLTVDFNAYNTWINIQDYGKTVVNSFAYYSLDGDLVNGEADTGGTIKDKELFKDLDDDGNPPDAAKNVHYAQNTTTFDPLTAAELGFRKYVKATDEQSYGVSSKVAATGTYTYQLRFANGKNVTSDNVVMFDVLESAYGSNPYWRGTLKSINTTHVKNKGIEPVIYYSTYQGFTNLTVDSDQADLTNTTIWSTTAPENMADVTAIAIDMSKKKDGTNYVFQPEEAALCYITMTAPSNYEDYIDNPSTDTDETVYAYNSAYIQTTSKLIDGGSESSSITECSPVTVSLKAPEVEIHKSSDPASGTQENPTDVEMGGTITYNLAISNTGKAEAIYNLKVEDVIPDGLTIQEDEIQYYLGSNASKPVYVKDATRVSVTRDGQKLEFSIDKLDAGETIHLLVPTTVAKVGKVFENTAKLTEFNGKTWNFESETTWHKTEEGYELPKTGGNGVFTIYFAGVALIFASVLGLTVKRKRKSQI